MIPRTLACVALLAAATTLSAQWTPAIRAGLASADLTKRQQAFEALVGPNAERTLEVSSPEVNLALLSLLRKENVLVRDAFLHGGGSSAKYGEGYSKYTSWVHSAVMLIAEQNPDIPGIWTELLMSAYNPESAFVRSLAKYGDKVTPFLVAVVRRPDRYLRRGDALIVLAQIVAYEQLPAARHNLGPTDIDRISGMIRSGLNDKATVTRYEPVDAISIMGNASDLATLEKIAKSDPEFVTNGGQSGTDLRYPLREMASRAVERLRKKLNAASNP